MHTSLFKRFFSVETKNKLSNPLEQSAKSPTSPVNLPGDALVDSMQALEPRIMLDAAAVTTGTEVVADQVAAEQALASTMDANDDTVPPVVRQTEALQDAIGMVENVANANEIVFIDSSVDQYEQILASINPSAEVVLLQADQDGLEQIADVLQTRQDIHSIHIISHGDAGQLFLGNSILSSESIQGEHADELLTIAAALNDSADILIYGCNFAEGSQGERAAQALANATGADVAASDDLTGAADLGGDWDLEFSSGSIEAAAVTAEGFNDVLAPVPLAFTNAQFVDGASVPDIYGGSSDGNGADFSAGDQFLFEDVDGGAAGGVDAVVTITEYTYSDSITGNDLSAGGTVLPSLQTIDDTANGIPGALQPILIAPPGLGQNEEFSVIFTVEYFSGGTANPLLVSSFVTPIDIDGNSAVNSTRESVAVTAPVVSITQNDPTTLDATLTRDNGETTITLVQPDSTNFNPGVTPPLPLPGGTIAAQQFAATFEVQDATEFTVELKTFTGTNLATPNRFYSLVFDQVTFQNPLTLSVPLVDLDGDDSSGAGDLDYTNVDPYNLNDNVSGISIADTDINITDSDSALTNLQGATVNLTNTIGGDRLNVDAAMLLADFGIVATGDGTSSIQLSGDSSIANYEEALASITYSTTDTVLNTTDRIIEVTVNNGDIESPVATSTINILAAPTVNASSIFNTAQPLITGTFDEGNATNTGLQVSVDDVDYILGVDPELSSDGNGNWILNLEGSAQTLTEGSFDVVASNIDAIGAVIDSDSTVNEVVVDFIAQPDTYSTSINNPLVIASANTGVLQNDSDNTVLIVSEVNGVPFAGSGSSATSAGGNVTLNDDGTFTYTPLAGFSGVDTFTYTVADANGNVNAPVTVTINVSAEIQAVNDSATANEDNVLMVNAVSGVLANDADLAPGPSVLNVTVITDPANNSTGTVGNPFLLDSGALVTLNMDGSYSYNPNGQFDTLASGESVADNFQYTVSDGVNTVTALATVIIEGTDDAPVLTADTNNPTFAEDGAPVDVFDNVIIDTVEPGQTIENIVFMVANVTEGSDEILTIDGVEIPLVAGGPINTDNGYSVTVAVVGNDVTVSVMTSGAAPNAVQTLVDGLTYQNNSQGPELTPREISISSISDSGNAAGANENTGAPLITSTVSLADSNDPLDAIDNTYTTAINTNVTGNVITDDTGAGIDNDPDNTPITVDPEFTSTPANGSVVVNTDGSFVYTPATGFEGTDSFTYRAVTPTTITGLNYELFDIVPTGFTVDNIPLINPDFTGTATDFDVDALALPLTGSLDTFAIRYTGFINIATAGLYNFRTTSDDGSSLSIDGVELVDNDGLHSAATVTSAGTFLSAGPHLITVEFFENFGLESLIVEFSGPDTGGLGMFSNLSGSDALVTADTDTATVTINIENMAPVNTVPGMQTVAEDTPLIFTGASLISVNDIDGNLASTQLSVNDGVLNVDLTGTGATISAGANDSDSLTLSGTQAQINAALATLSYQGNLDFNGNDTLTILSTDSAGTPLSDTDTVDITVNPVNDAPVNTVPGAQTVLEDTALNITGISTNDVDGNLATTQLSVDFGTLNVSLAGGATIAAGVNNSSTLTLSGTQAQINAALVTLNYQGDANFNGADTLTVLSTDSAGTPLTDSDTIAITVTEDNIDSLIAVDDDFATDQNTILNLPAPAVLNNDIGTENSGAYTFTGAGGGTTTSFNSLAGNPTNNSASFELLFRPDDVTDHDVLFETGATGDGTAITLDGTTLNFEVRNTLGANNTIERASVDLATIGITDPTADFIHVVGVFTLNTQLDLYVNGTLATSISGVGLTDFAGGNGTGVGQVNGGATIGGAGNFEGDIALFQFYESALNAAEVAQNFAAARLNNGTSAVAGATLSYDLVNDPNPNDNIIPGGQFDLTLNPSVNPSDALVVTAIEGNPADIGQTVTLASGALVTLNADGSFSYDPNGQFDTLAEGATAQDFIDYTISDPFGATDSATITVTISGINDAPVNTVPGMQTVAEDTPLLFTGVSQISVNDIDGNLASTQLSVADGMLNVDLTGTGATISAGVNGSGSLTISGTQAQINAALATLSYQGDLDFNGNDALTVMSMDSAGIPLSDTDNVDITITPVVDPVLVSLVGPGSVIEGEVTTDYTITLDTPVPTGNSVTVNLAYSGTAIDGTDFTGVASVVVTGPASTATFTLATIDDALAEGAENIIIDIDSIVDTDSSFEAIAEDAMNNQVTTVINDQVDSDAIAGAEDTVLVSIAGPGAVIEGEVTTDYTITLDTPVPTGNSVTVNLAYTGTAIDGTDFAGVANMVVIGPASTATFTLATIDDALAEGAENIIIDIDSIVDTNSSFEAIAEGAMNNQVTTVINDQVDSDAIAGAEDTVLVSIAGPGAVIEGEVTMDYTITLDTPVPSGNSVTVNLAYSGTAIDGTDFAGVANMVVIGPASTATFTLATIDDALAEGAENVIIDIDSITDTDSSFEAIAEDAMNNQVTTVINDQVGSDAIAGAEDTVLVSIAGPGAVIEGEVTTDYTITLDTPVPIGNSATVNLAYSGTAVDGTDFMGVASVIVTGPASTATFPLATIDDVLAEGAENIIIDIDSIIDTDTSFEAIEEDITANQVTTVINDDAMADPVLVSIAGPGSVIEGEVTTDYTITLDTPVPIGNSVTVNLAYSGTAVDGTDFMGVASVIVTGPASTATFTLATIDDVLAEGAENIIIDIDSIIDTDTSFEAIEEDITANQVTTVINDDAMADPVLVSIAGPGAVIEGEVTTDYTITLDTPVPIGNSVTVNLAYSGTAVDGTDFMGVASVIVTGPASTATFTLATIDDVLAEGAENIIIDIDSIIDTDTSFEAIEEDITANQVTTVINDDAMADPVLVSIAGPGSVIEGEVTTDYTITLDTPVPIGNSVTVNLAYSGTAVDGTDFMGVASVIVTGPASTATFTLATIDDVLAEGAENIIIDIDSIIDTDTSFEAIEEDITANQVTTVINDDAMADPVLVSIAGPGAVIEGEVTTDYTITLDTPVPIGNSVTVNLAYSGTAVDGTDFMGVASVIVTGPASTATFTLATIDDVLAEGAENIIIDIDSIIDTDTSFEAIEEDITANQVTTVINDDAMADPVLVSIAGPGSVIEGEVTTDYTITLDTPVPTGNSVTVNLAYSGTAIDGTDFTGVANVVVIGPASTATFTLATIDDALAEGAENIIIDIDSIVDTNSSFEAIVEDAMNNQVTTIINDDAVADTVLVSLAGPGSVIEGEVTMDYTITLDTPVPSGNSVTVNLAYSGTAIDGTDFTGVASVLVTGPASTATFTLATLDDALAEGDEDIFIDIDSIVDTDSSFEAIAEDVTANQVTTVINDQVNSDAVPGAEDTVLVSIAGPGAVIEGEVTTDYTITLDTPVPSGNSVTVNLAYSGTAVDGTDFTGVASVIVTGPATSATFTLTTIDDAFAEGAENIIIDIDSIVDTDFSFEAIAEDVTANQVTTVINDDAMADAVLVSIAGPGSVIEGEVTTDYTITLDTPVPTGNSVTVNLAYSGTAVDGTDFTGVASVLVTGPASTATFTLATLDDAFAEGAENIIIDIDSIVDTNSSFEAIAEDAMNNQVTTIINDDAMAHPVLVSIAGPGSVIEGEVTTDYTITLDTPVPTGNSVTVNLAYSGTAVDGTDFTGVANVIVTGPASTATFTLATIDDALAEGAENIIIDIDSITDTDSSFEAIAEDAMNNQVTTVINDDAMADAVLVSIAGPGSVIEGEVTTDYTIILDTPVPSGNSVTVNLAYTGTAIDGTDFTGVASVIVTGPATNATFTLATIDDALAEGAENIIIDIDSIVDTDSSFEAIAEDAMNNQVTTVINDDAIADTVVVSLAGPGSVIEGEVTTDYTITLDTPVPTGNSVTVNLAYSGTAVDGTDFTGVASVVVTGPASTATFTLATIDDALAEGAENIIIDIDSIVDTDSSFEAIAEDAMNNQVTTVINDQVGSDAIAGAEDTVLVSIAGPGSVIEGEVTTDYTITLDTPVPTGNSVTVNLAYSGTAVDGTDFTGVASVLVTGPATNATFTLATIDDALAEGAENIIIDIDSIVDTNSSFEAIAEDAMNNQVTTIINDDAMADPVLVSIAGPGAVIEGEVTTDYTITLDTPVPTGNSVTVNLAYSGTAIDGTDFTGVASVIVTGPASTATFTLATIDDALAEGAENVIIDIDSITDTDSSFEAIAEDAMNNQVTTVINDQVGSDAIAGAEDTVLVSIAGPGSVIEGEVTTDYTITLDTPVPTGNSVTVNLAYSGTAVDGTDFTGVTSVIVTGPATSATFTLATIDDALAEGAENIIIDIDSIVDTDSSFEAITEDAMNNQVTTVINDDAMADAVLVSIVGPGSVIEGEVTTDYTITLDTPVPTGNSVTVNLAYSGTAVDGTDFTGVASVLVTGPASTATFTLATLDDAFAEGAENIIIDIDSIVDTDSSFEAIAEDAMNNQVTTVINDQIGSDAVPGAEDTVLVSIVGPGTVIEGEVTTDYTITLDTPVPTGNSVTVNLAYSGTAVDGTDFTGVASVVVTGPASTATFTLATIDDALAEGAENIIIDIDSIVDTNSSFEAIAEDAMNNQVTTIINDDAMADAVLVSIAGPGSVIEGEVTTDYTITLDTPVPTGNSVTVNLAYSGTAVDGTDFTGVASVLVTGPASTATFTLATLDDAFAEGAENIIIDIDSIVDTNSSFEAIAEDAMNNQVTTIINDDAMADPVLVSIAGPGAVIEGEVTTDYTITLDTPVPTGNSVTVNLAYTGTAVDGTDFMGVASVIVTGPASTATFTLTTLTDGVAEGAENIIIDIDSIVDTDTSFEAIAEDAMNNQVTTLIADADSPVLTINDVSVDEDAGTATFIVTLSTNTIGGFTVDFNFTDGIATGGVDFDNTGGMLTFAGNAGEMQTITVPITNDFIAEGAETYTVNLSNVSNALVDISDTGLGTINDDVNVVLASLVGPGTVIEGEVTADYTVALSENVPVGNSVTVNLAYSGTAINGADFTGVASVVVTGPASTATFTLATIDDAFAEGAENIIIDIDSIVDTDSSFEAIAEDAINNQVTTVINDQIGSDAAPGAEDTVLVSIAGPGSVVEGEVTTDYTITLDTPVPSGNSVTVNLAYTGTAIDGTDFTGVASVIVTGPASTATFTLATIDDALAEGAENIIIDIDSIVDTDSSFEAIAEDVTANQVATVINDQVNSDAVPGAEDTVLVSLAGPGSVVEDDVTTDYTITLDTPVPTGNSVTVNLAYSGTATDGSDFTGVASVLVTGPASSATFTLATLTDGVAEGAEDIIIDIDSIVDNNNSFEAISEDVANNQVTTEVVDADLAELTVGDITINEADGTATFIIELSTATMGGFTVDYDLNDGSALGGTDFDNTSGTLTFAGTSNEIQTVTVPINEDTLIEGNETFNITFTNSSNPLVDISADGMATIIDNDLPAVPDNDGLVVPENLLNLILLEDNFEEPESSIGTLRVPNIVVDTVEEVNSEVFGDQINAYTIPSTGGLPEQSSISRFVYRTAIAELGSSQVDSLFPLRIGEGELEEDQDQLLISTLVINDTLSINVEFVNVSGFEVSEVQITQANGESLPDWLSFDNGIRSLAGEAPGDVEKIELKVLVRLSDGTEIVRYVEVIVANGEINELNQIQGIASMGILPFSEQVDTFANQFIKSTDQLEKLVL